MTELACRVVCASWVLLKTLEQPSGEILRLSGGSMIKILLSLQEMRLNSWAGKIPWRTKWRSTPVLLPGESHGQRSLAGHSPWGHRESVFGTEILPSDFLHPAHCSRPSGGMFCDRRSGPSTEPMPPCSRPAARA